MDQIEVGSDVFISNSVNQVMRVVDIDDETGLAKCEVTINNEKVNAYLPLEILSIEIASEDLAMGGTNSVDDDSRWD